MRYLFNSYGWYAGEGEGRRSTDVAPPIFSTTTVPGEDRANWTGNAWVVLPFEAHPDDDELSALRMYKVGSISAVRRQFSAMLANRSGADPDMLLGVLPVLEDIWNGIPGNRNPTTSLAWIMDAQSAMKAAIAAINAAASREQVDAVFPINWPQ